MLISGISGGSGKTFVSLGLARALVKRGLVLRPFKKGPDYIDAAWLTLAARVEACNLDQHLMSSATVCSLFSNKMHGKDMALVEGNRGLFDGGDESGSLSSSELARLLGLPVILVLDATKMTRTAAAIVHGVNIFEKDLKLGGVILNRVAGARHAALLRESIKTYTNVPVFGTLPKIKNPIPERHMGLWSNREMQGQEVILDSLADIMEKHLDIPGLLRVARCAPDLAVCPPVQWPKVDGVEASTRPIIGVIRDAALWFYYPENIEALQRAGAEIRELSILETESWPVIDGLYMGGGFPETLAARIADNKPVRDHVRNLALSGLPMYAECGGFIFLSRELVVGDRTYPMAGVFDLSTHVCARPQGLGYVAAVVDKPNVYHPVGTVLNGHEFHYSTCTPPHDNSRPDCAMRLTRGTGMHEGRDGLIRNNVFACYTHLHALGAPHWAVNFVAAARVAAANRVRIN